MVPDHNDMPREKASGPASTARRRLLRGSLGAAPVLLTVASRPVLAAAGECVSPSSHTSLNASGDNKTYPCSGRTPGFWKQSQKFAQWPAPYYPVTTAGHPATRFDDVFGVFGGYPGATLLQVLETGGNDLGRDALARHIVAALLNAQKGWTPPTVLSVEMVKHIWSEFVRLGYYEPTAGVRWYADYAVPATAGDGIIAYLQSTMPL